MVYPGHIPGYIYVEWNIIHSMNNGQWNIIQHYKEMSYEAMKTQREMLNAC